MADVKLPVASQQARHLVSRCGADRHQIHRMVRIFGITSECFHPGTQDFLGGLRRIVSGRQFPPGETPVHAAHVVDPRTQDKGDDGCLV